MSEFVRFKGIYMDKESEDLVLYVIFDKQTKDLLYPTFSSRKKAEEYIHNNYIDRKDHFIIRGYNITLDSHDTISQTIPLKK